MHVRTVTHRSAGLFVLAVLLAAVAFLLATGPSKAATVSVTVGTPANRFSPNVANINTGDTVTFTFGSGTHVINLRGASPDIAISSASTTGTTNAFATAGTYYYYCSIHATAAEAVEARVVANDAMVGKIVVTQAAATATATTATTTPSSTPTSTATTATATSTATPTAAATTATATSTPTRVPTLVPTTAPSATPTAAAPPVTVVAPGPPATGSGTSSPAVTMWLPLLGAAFAVAAAGTIGVIRARQRSR